MSPDATPWLGSDNPYRPGPPTCPRRDCSERPALTSAGWACPRGASEIERPRAHEEALRELAAAQAEIERLRSSALRWKALAGKLRRQREHAHEALHEARRRSNELDFQGMVSDFHDACGFPVRSSPTTISDEEARLRGRLISEEAFEVLAEMFPDVSWDRWTREVHEQINTARVDINVVNLAHELADLHYVTSGTACHIGVDEAAVFAEVSRANCEKRGGGKDEFGKAIKPSNRKPADVASVLRAQGWNDEQLDAAE